MRQGYDPIGSAPRWDRFVAVEVPTPWPSKEGEVEWLAAANAPEGTRTGLIVADTARITGEVLITRWERNGAALAGTDWLVLPEEVAAALAAVAAGDEPDVPGEPAPDEVLICSHGSRDICCGGMGTRLATEARAALPELRVRRTSHLGGHRFAPTAVIFPEGRMWAHLDIDILTGIVHRTAAPDEAREFYRGNPALDAPVQVVEAELLTDRGWAGFDFEDLTATAVMDGDRTEVELTYTANGGTDVMAGTVEIATRYPVLQCGLPPEEATKDAVEYRLVS